MAEATDREVRRGLERTDQNLPLMEARDMAERVTQDVRGSPRERQLYL